MFRAALVTLIACVTGCGAASAAGASPSTALYSWSGFDIGVQGGYGGAIEQDNLTVADFEVQPYLFPSNVNVGGADARHAIYGAHIGYDQQFGSLVLGIRGELDATRLSGATSNLTKFNLNSGANCHLGCVEYDTASTFDDRRQAFVLGRSGYAVDRLLVFAEGGLALSNARLSVDAARTFVNGNGRQEPNPSIWDGAGAHTLVGGAVGLGAEYALADHWQLGAEWRFVDFAGATDRANIWFSRDAYDRPVSYKAGFSENLGLLGASYRF